jgi:penicillin-insensitive murein endopeptidase
MLGEMRRLALAFTILGGGCAALGGVDDGTSVAAGWTSRGVLRNAVELPVRGDGYRIPEPWASRGLRWGTEELVGVVVRAGRRMAREAEGATLHVGDLSPRHGGPSAWHRSHQTGRDADLHFFAVDDAGAPIAPPGVMLPFHEGVTAPGADGKVRWFDVARNWLLVRALLEDPAVEVQWLFIAEPLRQRLLAHAAAIGEPLELQARAAAVMQQPGDSLPHDDHLHVRIFCPASDRSLGCRDLGPRRWLKKEWKYARAPRPPEAEVLAALPPVGPMCKVGVAALVAGK